MLGFIRFPEFRERTCVKLVSLLEKVIRFQTHSLLLNFIFMRMCAVVGDDERLKRGLNYTLHGFTSYREREKAVIEAARYFIDLGNFEESRTLLIEWIKSTKNVSARCAALLALCLRCMSLDEQSKRWYQKAFHLYANSRREDPWLYKFLIWNYSRCLFRDGQFARGYHYYSQRPKERKIKERDFWKVPELNSIQELQGGNRLLIFQEQGLGDVIHDVRFVNVLSGKGISITLYVSDFLVRLFCYSFPNIQVCSNTTSLSWKKYDYRLSTADLPFVAGLRSFSDIPSKFPYLYPKKSDVKYFAKKLVHYRRPRVGIVWRGNTYSPLYEFGEFMMNRQRSVPFSLFRKYILGKEASFVSLQAGEGKPGGNKTQTYRGVISFMPSVEDMADTAALIKTLDLVISVDTSVAHLAGALDSCPTWVISRRNGYHKWGNREDATPWYPNVKIFRPHEKKFDTVMALMGRCLDNWIKVYVDRERRT